MDWNDVGQWLKKNGGGLLGLAGAVATGNIPAGVAAVAGMVTQATGETDPALALDRLVQDPQTRVRLAELAQQSEADLRAFHKAVLEIEIQDKQEEHRQQQETIRNGDNAEDQYTRHTRPLMARQSWYATMAYVIGFEGLLAAKLFEVGANWELAMLLLAPAAAYLGFRSFDKKNESVATGLLGAKSKK